MYIPFLALVAVATASIVPRRLDPTSDRRMVSRQAKSPCDTPGALVCNGPTQQGLCDIDNTVVFMSVAAGTVCSCQGNQCSIAADNAGASNAQPVPSPPLPSEPASTSDSIPPTPPSSSSGPQSSLPSASFSPLPPPSSPLPPPSSPLPPPSSPLPAPSSPLTPTSSPLANSSVGGTSMPSFNTIPAPSPYPTSAAASLIRTHSKSPAHKTKTTSKASHTKSPGHKTKSKSKASHSKSTSHSKPAPSSPLPPPSSPLPPPSSPLAPTSTSSASKTPSPSAKAGYQVYKGNGSPKQGWPSEADWLDFEGVWKGYAPIIGKNCKNLFTPVRDNTKQETENLRQAILSESKKAGVPSNFALALAVQESLGCVAIATTDNGVSNPGIDQCHAGKASCFNKDQCSASEIQDMVHEGIFGTSAGEGLQQIAAKQKKEGYGGAQQWYRTARTYNSGSIAADGDLNDGVGSTNCYVMDVANRLTGQWFDGDDLCTLNA